MKLKMAWLIFPIDVEFDECIIIYAIAVDGTRCKILIKISSVPLYFNNYDLRKKDNPIVKCELTKITGQRFGRLGAGRCDYYEIAAPNLDVAYEVEKYASEKKWDQYYDTAEFFYRKLFRDKGIPLCSWLSVTGERKEDEITTTFDQIKVAPEPENPQLIVVDFIKLKGRFNIKIISYHDVILEKYVCSEKEFFEIIKKRKPWIITGRGIYSLVAFEIDFKLIKTRIFNYEFLQYCIEMSKMTYQSLFEVASNSILLESMMLHLAWEMGVMVERSSFNLKFSKPSFPAHCGRFNANVFETKSLCAMLIRDLNLSPDTMMSKSGRDSYRFNKRKFSFNNKCGVYSRLADILLKAQEIINSFKPTKYTDRMQRVIEKLLGEMNDLVKQSDTCVPEIAVALKYNLDELHEKISKAATENDSIMCFADSNVIIIKGEYNPMEFLKSIPGVKHYKSLVAVSDDETCIIGDRIYQNPERYHVINNFLTAVMADANNNIEDILVEMLKEIDYDIDGSILGCVISLLARLFNFISPGESYPDKTTETCKKLMARAFPIICERALKKQIT